MISAKVNRGIWYQISMGVSNFRLYRVGITSVGLGVILDNDEVALGDRCR